MKKIITNCPSCNQEMKITSLQCPSCGVEMKSSFDISPFDRLNEEQYTFLLSFLKQRGNLKNVQSDLCISYPTAKKKLDELLYTLELAVVEPEEREEINLSNLVIDENSTKASEIIKAKLKENGGRATVYTVTGLPCEIWADTDGKRFGSNKLLVNPHYEYIVFDIVVDLLLANGGKARKGNGRNYKMGAPECDETTVVGAIGKYYWGKEDGESVFDPVFVVAAVLEWAGIARNERGELSLTSHYRSML